MPVPRLPDSRTEMMTASATSLRSVLKADINTNNTKEDGGFVTVRAGDKAIHAVSGVSTSLVATKPAAGTPTAGISVGGTQVAGHYIGAYEEKTFGVNYNEYVAVIEY